MALDDDNLHPNQDIDDGFLTDNGEIDGDIREENYMDVENSQPQQDRDDDLVAHINSPVGEGLLDVPPASNGGNQQEFQDVPTIPSSQVSVFGVSSSNYSNQASEEVLAPQDLTAERDLEKGLPQAQGPGCLEMAFDNENSHMQANDHSSSVEYIDTTTNNNPPGPQPVHPQDMPYNNQQDEDQHMVNEEEKEQNA